MTSAISNPELENLRAIILQLPPQELQVLLQDIEERLRSFEWMKLAESSFQDWNDEAEAIYDE